MNKRIVIVGGVAAGASCAARARRLSEESSIVVFERGPHVSFANCGLPYYLGGEIADRSKLLVQSPESLRARFRLDVRTLHEVIAIDRENKTVRVLNKTTGDQFDEPYDDLVLAVGAAPIKPPLPGIDLPGNFVLRDISDMDAIHSWIANQSATRAVVIGGGFIGLEVAEQFRHRGLHVTLVESSPHVMPPIDVEMAALLHRELNEHGVELILGDAVSRFETAAAGGVTVVTKSGRSATADVVVLGMGVRPDLSLPKVAGLEIGKSGGLLVDENLRTSDPNIWAAGDCIEITQPILGRPGLIPLAGPANRQGRMIADNIFGGERTYSGTIGTAILKLFSLQVACVGANERTLRASEISFEVAHLHPGSHAGYYPGASPIALKLLFSKEDGKIFGAQAVGRDGVDKRIDVIATAIRGGLTIDDLAELELAYAPPFGSAKDPINLAGMIAQNVRDGLVRMITPAELMQRADVTIVDVRDPKERERGYIPQSISLPLDQLRDRLGELPKDREVVVYCQSGQRSYNAARILMQNGYRCANLSGAFNTWSAAGGYVEQPGERQ